jgi:hypothetical protein
MELAVLKLLKQSMIPVKGWTYLIVKSIMHDWLEHTLVRCHFDILGSIKYQ